MKMNLAESALNRLMNFADEIDAQDLALQQALQAPPPEMPADPAIAEAMVMDSLGLAPK